MYQGKSVAVVIPAYNEELLIKQTIETIPEFVDKIVVVNDFSKDRTAEIVETCSRANPKVVAINLDSNGGVGVAIRTGYIWCRDNNIDLTAVMAGDGQMDPADLPALLDPVASNHADYAKGNRLVTGEAWKKIPRVRYLGNSALTFLTKIASGYWHVTDSQTGYTVIALKTLKLIPIENIFPRYGMPNDLLVTLNIYNQRVIDVPVKPVYGIGEKSGIRIRTVVFTLSFLILKLFGRRMVHKYIIRDFHPLVLFYLLGIALLVCDLPLFIRLLYLWHQEGAVPPMTALTMVFCTIVGLQSLLFAMLFDMEANRHLNSGQQNSRT